MAWRGAPRPMPKGGRKPWKPNDEQRMHIRVLSTEGATQEKIAAIMGVSVETLVKHCRAELEDGVEIVNAQIAGSLVSEAMKGNVTAIIWYEKTRRRMKDVTAHEISGPNGGAIPVDHSISAKEAAERFKEELG